MVSHSRKHTRVCMYGCAHVYRLWWSTCARTHTQTTCKQFGAQNDGHVHTHYKRIHVYTHTLRHSAHEQQQWLSHTHEACLLLLWFQHTFNLRNKLHGLKRCVCVISDISSKPECTHSQRAVCVCVHVYEWHVQYMSLAARSTLAFVFCAFVFCAQDHAWKFFMVMVMPCVCVRNQWNSCA